MTSRVTRNIPSGPISTRLLRKQMHPPRWSISDTAQFCSIKNAIRVAKEKGYESIGRFNLRPNVRTKLVRIGYKVRFNCGYWIIYWS